MKTIDVVNPASGELLQSYDCMSQTEVDSTIQFVSNTQKSWAKTDFAMRKKPMLKLSALLREQADTLAELITGEMGKPIIQAKGEVEKCAWLCEYYAETAEIDLKPQLVDTGRTKSYRCFEPQGIVFGIMPWNFPFWQVFRYVVPNLMLGNACVLKHAPNSTGAALAIEKLYREAGFPEDLFRALVMDVDLAPFVIHHPKISGVTLTGSGRAGKSVAQEAGKALKKVVLELGGSDPYLVLDDADLDLAVEQSAKSRFSNTGQICISAKRIIVCENVYDAFVEKFLHHVDKTYQYGDPLNENTSMGPLAREDLRDNLDRQVQESIAKGAKCIKGGKPAAGKGFYYEPTILLDVKKGMPAYDEETFGPVACIFKVKDEAEATQMANDTPYGLTAAVFTKDLVKGERIAQKVLQVGACHVNGMVGSDPRLPFGGTKQSGFGRELSSEGLHEFANVKTVVIA